MHANPKPEANFPFISEHAVTLPRLAKVLETAFMDSEVDEEGELFVGNTLEWPVWIKIERPAKLITLETCTDAADQFDNVPEAMEWVNEANAQIGLVQFHVAKEPLSNVVFRPSAASDRTCEVSASAAAGAGPPCRRHANASLLRARYRLARASSENTWAPFLAMPR